MVLTQFRRNQLYVKGGKCDFHISKVSFQGYINDKEGVSMDSDKVKAVSESMVPQIIKNLLFLGFAFYSCIYHRGGTHDVSTQEWSKKLKWNEQAQSAFERLKKEFTPAPILHHPDLERLFCLSWRTKH